MACVKNLLVHTNSNSNSDLSSYARTKEILNLCPFTVVSEGWKWKKTEITFVQKQHWERRKEEGEMGNKGYIPLLTSNMLDIFVAQQFCPGLSSLHRIGNFEDLLYFSCKEAG